MAQPGVVDVLSARGASWAIPVPGGVPVGSVQATHQYPQRSGVGGITEGVRLSTDRRTIVRAAAWSAPVLAVAAAAPVAAASAIGTLSPLSFTYAAGSGNGQFALSPPLSLPAASWSRGWVSVFTSDLTLTVTGVGPADSSGATGFFTSSGTVPAGTLVLATVIIPGYAPLNVTAVAS